MCKLSARPTGLALPAAPIAWGTHTLLTPACPGSIGRYLDCKKKLRPMKMPLGPVFRVAMLLQNCKVCLRVANSEVSQYFDISANVMPLSEYLA